MMNDADLSWLVQQLVGTAELLGQPLSPVAAAMLAEDLSSYPREVLARALSRVRTEHSGRLTPKAVLDRIDEVLGRPAANEAWAIAVQALDERATVVWTDETADAWSLAQPLAAAGDLVGARMAFISAYERLVRSAREQRRVPAMAVSIGWDSAARDAALERAVQLGHIAPSQRQEHCASLAAPVFSPVALLAGKVEVTVDAPPQVRARLAELRDELAARGARRQRKVSAQARLARMQQRQRQQAIDVQVKQRIAQEQAVQAQEEVAHDAG